jgi:hypothetical protein
MAHTRSYWRARFLFAGGAQLPVDLSARLEAEGYDLTELTRRHAL